VFKKIIFVSFILLTSGCKPVVDKINANSDYLLIMQCIDSQSRCEVSTEFANFSLKFSQQQLLDKIKTELPFFIELSLFEKNSEQNVELSNEETAAKSTQKSITKVSAYLEGKDMFMGKVPVFFKRETDDGTYLAESLLASCSEEQMVWRLWITVEMAEKKQTFFIDFTSQRL
jgi:hypothetical protein